MDNSHSAGIAVMPLSASMIIKKTSQRLMIFLVLSILKVLCISKCLIKKNLFYSLDHIFQCCNMIRECLFTGLGNCIGCICFSPNKSLVHSDIPVVFKIYQVGSKISIRYFEHLFEVIEIDFLIHHQYTHNTETNAVVKNFI